TTCPHDCQVHKGAATCERIADSTGNLALLQCVAADAVWNVAPVDSGTNHHWCAERRRTIHLHTPPVIQPILRIQRRRHGAHALTEAIEIDPLRVPYPGSECGARNAVLDRRTPTGWNAGVCNHRVAHPGIQITAHLCGRTDREATNGRVQHSGREAGAEVVHQAALAVCAELRSVHEGSRRRDLVLPRHPMRTHAPCDTLRHSMCRSDSHFH